MNYAATAARIIKKIAKYGKTIWIRTPGTADGWTKEYDPAYGGDKWTNDETHDVVYVDPATTPVDNRTKGVEMDYTVKEIDGEMIKQGDRRFYIGADITKPEPQNRVILGSTSSPTEDLAVISCKRIAPGDTVLLYEVQCRG
jgi:hypothetical protein